MVLLGFLQRGDNFDRKVFAALVVESYLQRELSREQILQFCLMLSQCGVKS